MPNPIAQLLEQVGLYRPINSAVHRFTDPQVRELRRDVRSTRRQIGSWAGRGIERADPDRRFGILSFTNIPYHAKIQCLIAKAMQLRGWTPVVFTRRKLRYGQAHFRTFGIDQFIYWEEFAAGAVAEDAAASLADGLMPDRLGIAEAKALRFRGVDVGIHALSHTCRTLVEGHLDMQEPGTRARFRTFLAVAIQAVLATEHLLDRLPLQKLLVRDMGYVPNGSIYQTALLRGVDCIVYDEGQKRSTWVLKRTTPASRNAHYFSIAPQTWARIREQPWTAEDNRAVDEIFRRRYEPDSQDDLRRLQLGKKDKTVDQIRGELGLTAGRKVAVVFSHVSWDAAFFYGDCLFDDFDDWLFQTVKFAAENCPELDWVIKLHPYHRLRKEYQSSKEEAELKHLRPLMPLPPHVKLVRSETEINTSSLFPVADYVLTVNGTVGMEFPCFGVPAIVAGTGRYSGLGFTVDPTTREEYFGILKDLDRMPRLDQATIQLARRHFRALMDRRQVSFESVAPLELKKVHEAITDVHNNLHFTPRSLQEFESVPVVRRLADWLGENNEPDFLES